MRQPYDTDLTDEQFVLVKPFLPKPKATGRPPADLREVINAILYLVRSGCQWRMLPHDFPPWSTVHTWHRRWRLDGTWDRIHDALVPQVRLDQGRLDQGRHPQPRTSALDSQSVKTTEMGGPRGFDSGKKVKGRKRHIWVDSLGLLLAVLVTAADVPDSLAGCDLVSSVLWTDLPRLERIYGDGGYTAGYFRELMAQAPFDLVLVHRNPDQKGWQLLPKRWVVERTLAWLGRARRLSKDYERRTESSEAMIKICMIHHMLERLQPSPQKQAEDQTFRYAA
jgi:putative transposase